MGKKKILMPYNFTTKDRSSLEFVIQRYKKREDVEISLFHLYTPVPDIEINDKTVMQRMAANMNYLRYQISERKNEIEAVREKLVDSGFEPDRVKIIFKPQENDVAGEIMTQVKQGGFQTIILTRNPGRITTYFTQSISKKVCSEKEDHTCHIVT